MGTAPSPLRSTGTSEHAGGVTYRSFLIGLLCVVALSILSPVTDVLIGSFVAARHQAPALATLLFLGVLLVNLAAKCCLRRPLNTAELMVVYCMVLITAGVASTGLTDYLIPHLVGVFHYETAENDFAATFFPHIRRWLVPSKDPDSIVVRGFFLGGIDVPLQPWRAPLVQWVRPLAVWSSFFLAMYVLQFCIANVLRKQWVERERLVFPLIQFPLSLVEEEPGRRSAPVLRNPLFWSAAGAMALLYAYNALPHYFPFIKPIPLIFNVLPYVPEAIRKHLAGTTAYLYPAAVGFFYFATLEVSFSIPFFYVFDRVQQAVGGLLGVNWFTRARLPAASEAQQVGAVVVMLGFGLFAMRRHIMNVLRSVFRGPSEEDREEAISYRWSVIGTVLGLLYLSVFLNLAGMSFGLALVLMVLLCLWLIALSRMVAEGGILWGQITVEPYRAVTSVVGTHGISAADWTVIGYCYLYMIDMQAALMPAAVQTLKISSEKRLDRRKLLLAMLVAIVVAMPLSYYCNLRASYALGASKTGFWSYWALIMSPPLPFEEAARKIAQPTGPSGHAIAFMVVGAVMMAGLMLLRRMLAWWPLHPIGLAMFGSLPTHRLWFSALVAFCLKAVILRYGGLKLYNRLKPLFLGAIFGGFVVPAVILAVNTAVGSALFDVGAWP